MTAWPTGDAIHEREVTPDSELVEARRSKDGAGEINVPIGCAGPPVAPRDLVLGVADGVIAISPRRLSQLLEKGRAELALEEAQQRHHLASRTDHSLFALDEERANAMLREKGCPV